MFTFCLIINLIFLLFGLIILTTDFTGINTVQIKNNSVDLNFDMNNLILSIVSGVIVMALAGFNFFGLGLRDASIDIITKLLKWLLLWSIISIFSIDMFSIIPFNIGDILYLLLTIIYALSFLVGEVSIE